MRTKKELLELLLAEWEKSKTWNGENKYSGLCRLIFLRLPINDKETNLLFETVKKGLLDVKKTFLFPPYEHQPRVEWLKKQIELCDKL